MEEKETFSLEEAFEKLEEAVAELEKEGITLEQAFQEYKKGMEILKKCNETIDEVEKKVLVINGNGETDEF